MSKTPKWTASAAAYLRAPTQPISPAWADAAKLRELGRVYRGVLGPIAYMSDGSLVVGSSVGVSVHAAEDLRPLREFDVDGRVRRLACHGESVFVEVTRGAEVGGRVLRINLDDGEQQLVCTDAVGLALTPDGAVVVTLPRQRRSDKPRLAVHRPSDAKPRVLTGRGQVDGSADEQLAVAPDGRWIAYAIGKTVLLFELAGGKLARTVEFGRKIWGLDFAGDGRLVVGCGQSIAVVAVATGTVDEQGDLDELWNAATLVVCRSGTRVLVGDSWGNAQVYAYPSLTKQLDVSGEFADVLEGSYAQVVALNSDATQFACVAVRRGSVAVYQFGASKGRRAKPSAKPRGELGGFSYGVAKLDLTPDGHAIWIPPYRARIHRTNTKTGDTQTLGQRDDVVDFALGSDGAELAVLERSFDGRKIAATVRIVGTSNGKPSAALSVAGEPVALAWSARSELLAVATGELMAPGQVTLRRRDAARPLKTFKGASVRKVCFSPDGQLLAIAFGGDVQVVAVPSGKLVLEHRAPALWVCSLGFSPDGRLLVAGGREGEPVRVFTIAAPSKQPRKLAVEAMVTAIGFSPASEQLILGTEQGDIAVWRTSTWKQASVVRAHNGAVVRTVVVGDALVSSSHDGTIRFWGRAP